MKFVKNDSICFINFAIIDNEGTILLYERWRMILQMLSQEL